MKFHFTDIGREKRSFSAEIHDANNPQQQKALIAQVKREGRLLSRNVDLIFVSEEGGMVVVGGWRPVGNFTVTNK